MGYLEVWVAFFLKWAVKFWEGLGEQKWQVRLQRKLPYRFILYFLALQDEQVS